MSFLNDLFSAGVWGEKTPTAPKWNKWVHRNLSDNHCEECLMLDGCWFLKEKTPKWPHHPFCHCVLEDKYISGNYELGKLNDKGQRISIRVEIPRKDQEGIVSFITGWMVRPNGHIQLATPYGGK